MQTTKESNPILSQAPLKAPSFGLKTGACSHSAHYDHFSMNLFGTHPLLGKFEIKLDNYGSNLIILMFPIGGWHPKARVLRQVGQKPNFAREPLKSPKFHDVIGALEPPSARHCRPNGNSFLDCPGLQTKRALILSCSYRRTNNTQTKSSLQTVRKKKRRYLHRYEHPQEPQKRREEKGEKGRVGQPLLPSSLSTSFWSFCTDLSANSALASACTARKTP